MNNIDEVKLNFPLVNCRIGEVYKASLTFRVIEISMVGTTVKILDLQQGEEQPASKPQPQIVPSPS